MHVRFAGLHAGASIVAIAFAACTPEPSELPNQTGGTTAGGGVAPERGGEANRGGQTMGGGATGGAQNGGGTADGGKPTGGRSTGGNPTKFFGNITSREAIDPAGLKFYRHWDQITPENAGKWGSVQSTTGSAFNWGALDAIYDYAQQYQILFKEHTFVWGYATPTGTITLDTVENWIRSFCERYPKVALIDVVNEPPPHSIPPYASVLGAGESGTYGWITKAFKLARQHCGNATLILNDYNNIEYASSATQFISIVTEVQAAGAPIDAVGAQAHELDSELVSFSTVTNFLANLASQTGLPVYITGLDLSAQDDAVQLSLYQQYVPFFLATSYIHGVTLWGWIYGSTDSLAPAAGLVRGTSPRPAMTWLMQTLGRPNVP